MSETQVRLGQWEFSSRRCDVNGLSWSLTYDDGSTPQTITGWGECRLLPAERPDGVPDDAVPFVGWVSRDPGVAEGFLMYAPSGMWMRSDNRVTTDELGLPVPPEPSLADRLRREVLHLIEPDRVSAPAFETRVVDLLSEAADALDARSQP